MKIKYYFVFFAAFTLIIGGGFYGFNSSESTITLGGSPLTLPNAIWIILGITLFFVLSLIFFTSNWISKSLNQYKLEKDYQKLISQIYAQILKDSNFKPKIFATKDYKILSKILEKLSLEPKLQSPVCENEKIDFLFEVFKEINDGNVSSKLPLNPQSPFWERNTQNKLHSEPKSAYKILEEDYTESIKIEAIKVLAQNNLINEKLLQKLTPEILTPSLASTLLDELLQKGYKLSESDFVKIILSSAPTHQTYLKLAQTFKSQFDPEYTLSLFNTLANTHLQAKEAYAYLLLDYGMSEKAQEFLAENDELILPKIYLELKQSGKIYPLELFFKF